ncbi:hypothetical protein Nepgr_014755 [Nepenthes gracilis]|uniref:Uncharacterized protein n=1 Tax=Nepenthes gracilis TaxID=150966 RepID=A0AAD3XQF6_NEPGR|nr:hypothetical protein Nepgr_014755 [Nepenthes gracilis]
MGQGSGTATPLKGPIYIRQRASQLCQQLPHLNREAPKQNPLQDQKFRVAPAVWVGWRDCNFATDQFLLMPGVGRDCRMASSDKQLKGAGSCGRPFCRVVASSLGYSNAAAASFAW